jgi:light-regulated signal transduction histidine kinase (bacteriophytochrome)
MKELTAEENLKTEQTRELMESLDKKQKELTEYQTNIVGIAMYASDLQTYIAVKKIEKGVETHDTCLQSLINSENLNQTKLGYKIDTGLKTITTNIQKFGEVVVESISCELTFARKKNKQAQMMVAEISPPLSVDNIQLKLKQKININGRNIRGCSLLPDGFVLLWYLC